MPRRPNEIDELLAEGRLGGPRRERILGRVLKTVQPSRASPLRMALAAALALGSVTAAIVVFVAVRRPLAPTSDLRAKGATSRAEPSIDPLCSSGGTGACRVGERLFFRVDAAPVRRWLTAYAERIDGGQASQRIWMFPAADGATPEIPASTAPSILRRAVELGAGVVPGHYRLTIVVFDHRPTPAEAIDARAGGARVTRSLVIE